MTTRLVSPSRQALRDNEVLLGGESYLIDNELVGLVIAASTHIWDNEALLGGVGIVLVGKVNVTLDDNLIGLCKLGIVAYTTGCGWEEGESKFSGAITGTRNRIYGLKTALCPDYPGAPWPDGFIDKAWEDTIAKADAAHSRRTSIYR